MADSITAVWYFAVCGWILLHSSFISGLTAQDMNQQYFRVEPKDLRAQEGSQVTLPCEVEFRKGRVQWTKDGFALGYDAEIPGHTNYRMIGDSSHGVFNLQIKNISLEEDAEYECQVGPNRTLNVNSIRAAANLTVLSPPASLEMVGFFSNQQVKIKENDELWLECHVHKSKPAAKIVWYRDRSELKLDERKDKTTVSNPDNLNPRTKLYDVSSKIRLTPTADDDGVKYWCEAQHEALPVDMALRTSVQLSVLYTFKDPYIEGYDPKKDILRRGQSVELACRSVGGNPPPQLVWYRNDEEIAAKTDTYGRMTVNVYSFKADTKDNKARYTCKASSVANPIHKKVETVLTVNYAPLHVIILGSTQAKVGDTVHLNCTSGPSNPAASIRWLVDGRQLYTNNSQTVRDTENGWSTSSTISIFISPDKMDIVVICHGVNALLNENVVATHKINVLYPPGEPVISGYEPGKYIESGTVQHLMCKSSGGNPLANLTWSKNDREIHSITKIEKNKFVYSEIHILVNLTDNDAVYKCSAKNDAIDIPLFQTAKFNVYFPPDNVVIRKEPKDFRAGTVGKLICDASSSNPEANLTFWKNGIEIEGINRKSKPGLHGGNVTSIVTELNVTADMDGNVFTCQAQNPNWGRNAHAEIPLSVLYKPIFSELNETVFIGVEGDSLVVLLSAIGRPPAMTYTWSKNGVPLAPSLNYLINGSTLNFTGLNRTDVGNYSCEAINSEGSTFMNFSVNVQYSATISSYAYPSVMVGENEDAELWCVIDAYPLGPEHVTWRKPGFPMETRTSKSFVNNTAFLRVRGVTRKDMGQFYCVADNGLGNETSRAVYLAVKHKPEIDTSPVLMKAAAKPNGTGRLICRASSAPKPIFAWFKDSHTISVNTSKKYLARYNQLDPITYESILLIQSVELSDYGPYECKVTNTLGLTTTNVRLLVPTQPDSPVSMNLVNFTYNSVTIAWEPGFDGGEPCSFNIRYRDSGALSSNFDEVKGIRDTVHTVTGLLPSTSYVFSVSARNHLGASNYTKNTLTVTTSSDPQPTRSHATGPPTGMSLVIGAVVALVLIVANLLLLIFCLLKRSRKQIVTGVNEQSSNKSGTIEMYAPSSYNETMTGETLSSVSEKSETYSDSRQDYDEKKRNGGNAYMIEQIDYPFQYPGYDTHPKEHNSIGHHRNPYITHNGTGYQSENSSRYSSTADPRYITYPPPVQFAQPTLAPNGTLRRGTVPPPDVTVLTAPPPVSMSTFNYGSSETEGHLV